jgi:hypothetical protein
MVARTCNLSIWEAEAGASQVPGQLGYIVAQKRRSKKRRRRKRRRRQKRGRRGGEEGGVKERRRRRNLDTQTEIHRTEERPFKDTVRREPTCKPRRKVPEETRSGTFRLQNYEKIHF